MNKKQRMGRLNRQIAEHFNSLYAPENKRLVFGEGDPHAKVVLVGEAPGEQEALQGKPFVGKAGKLLDEFLRATGLARAQLYITNVVKLRPTAVSKAGRTVNRPPTKEEIALFGPWLQKELEIIAPAYIVTMGNVALRALSGEKGAVIGEKHGKLQQTQDGKALLYPLYHPAAVIYNRALRQVYDQDLDGLRRALNGEDPARDIPGK